MEGAVPLTIPASSMTFSIALKNGAVRSVCESSFSTCIRMTGPPSVIWNGFVMAQIAWMYGFHASS